MKKETYTAPVIEIISVELEKGIAASGNGAPAGYGATGMAGAVVDETGTTIW